jgi:hypothetical protein
MIAPASRLVELVKKDSAINYLHSPGDCRHWCTDAIHRGYGYISLYQSASSKWLLSSMLLCKKELCKVETGSSILSAPRQAFELRSLMMLGGTDEGFRVS